MPLQPALLDGIGQLYLRQARHTQYFQMRFIDGDEGKGKLRSTHSATYGPALRALIRAVMTDGTAEAQLLVEARRADLERLAALGEHQRHHFPEWTDGTFPLSDRAGRGYSESASRKQMGKKKTGCMHNGAASFDLPADSRPDGPRRRWIVQTCAKCGKARIVAQSFQQVPTRDSETHAMDWVNVVALPWWSHSQWAGVPKKPRDDDGS